jgi:hypothetical protein
MSGIIEVKVSSIYMSCYFYVQVSKDVKIRKGSIFKSRKVHSIPRDPTHNILEPVLGRPFGYSAAFKFWANFRLNLTWFW